jgi:hypothetical protein
MYRDRFPSKEEDTVVAGRGGVTNISTIDEAGATGSGSGALAFSVPTGSSNAAALLSSTLSRNGSGNSAMDFT